MLCAVRQGAEELMEVFAEDFLSPVHEAGCVDSETTCLSPGMWWGRVGFTLTCPAP